MKKSIKPVLPSLREKKRYLTFEIISKSKIKDFSNVSKAVWSVLTSFIGELGAAKAGIWLLPDKYNKKSQRGIIKVNHKYVNNLKSSLSLIRKIEGEEVIVRSLIVSGMISKASKLI